ncbi:hypothetical protein GCM10023189_35160 [Nibrella saemangeumensis]|uniref:Uncharacterized protein n=1 Tax=Nibrella saemangeumensis TaxID=1084526 RepID=A0ABP8N6U0_9BACT
MKILQLLLVFTTLTTYAQETVPPAKGDNTILVRTNLPDEEAFTMIRGKLADLGYTFRENRDSLLFKTNEKPIDRKPAYQVATVIKIANGVIVLSGQLTTIFEGTPASFPIQYTSPNSTMYRYGFKVLQDLGKSLEGTLPGTLVAYSKQ